ncbi:MAG: metal-dependent transcriptional regulator [Solirubrobacteraceae bacterium]|nr:metal-dependent transcriptional regulator [Solirubrobacteraceae bacterium]
MASAPSSPPTTAVEDYLKAVFALESRLGGAVPTTALAERLGITPGSVSAMLRRLADLDLLEHEPYRGVRLTDGGRRVALRTIRNHRLLELFLVEILDVPWDRVHDEAERLEHAVSDDLVERIAAKLGHPAFDPHGDPIPDHRLEIAEQASTSLIDVDVAGEVRFVRVSDADPAMLRYLAARGIVPGVTLTVVDRQPFGGPLTVRVDGDEHALGPQLADAMRVSRCG